MDSLLLAACAPAPGAPGARGGGQRDLRALEEGAAHWLWPNPTQACPCTACELSEERSYLFKWMKKNQKKNTVSCHVELYKIHISVSIAIVCRDCLPTAAMESWQVRWPCTQNSRARGLCALGHCPHRKESFQASDLVRSPETWG